MLKNKQLIFRSKTQSESEKLSHVKPEIVWFVFLHDDFLELCEDYVNIINDKYAKSPKVDRLSKHRLSLFCNNPENLEN